MPKSAAHPLSHHKHWHYLYHKRRQRALGVSSKSMAGSQVFALLGAIVAGILLENNKDSLALIAGAFVLLPGVFDLTGTLGAVLSAKINHRLAAGGENPLRVLTHSTGYTGLVAIFGGLVVALIGAGVSVLLFGADFWQVFWLAELAIALSALVGFPIIGALSLVFIAWRINPDDVIGPIESSLFDILAVITLTVAAGWLI